MAMTNEKETAKRMRSNRLGGLRGRGGGLQTSWDNTFALFSRLLITDYLTRNQQIYDVASSLSTAAGEALKRIKVTSRCDMGIYFREFMRFPEFAAIKRQTSRESFERS